MAHEKAAITAARLLAGLGRGGKAFATFADDFSKPFSKFLGQYGDDIRNIKNPKVLKAFIEGNQKELAAKYGDDFVNGLAKHSKIITQQLKFTDDIGKITGMYAERGAGQTMAQFLKANSDDLGQYSSKVTDFLAKNSDDITTAVNSARGAGAAAPGGGGSAWQTVKGRVQPFFTAPKKGNVNRDWVIKQLPDGKMEITGGGSYYGQMPGQVPGTFAREFSLSRTAPTVIGLLAADNVTGGTISTVGLTVIKPVGSLIGFIIPAAAGGAKEVAGSVDNVLLDGKIHEAWPDIQDRLGLIPGEGSVLLDEKGELYAPENYKTMYNAIPSEEEREQYMEPEKYAERYPQLLENQQAAETLGTATADQAAAIDQQLLRDAASGKLNAVDLNTAFTQAVDGVGSGAIDLDFGAKMKFNIMSGIASFLGNLPFGLGESIAGTFQKMAIGAVAGEVVHQGNLGNVLDAADTEGFALPGGASLTPQGPTLPAPAPAGM